MALEPLSGNSKVVVYNSSANLDDKTSTGGYQGVTVAALVAAAAAPEKVYRAEVNMTTGVATVFKNTTGGTISFVSIGAGNIGTAPNTALFGGDYEVYVSATDKSNVGDGEVPAVVSAKHTTNPAIVSFSRVDQFTGAVNGIIYIEIALY
jgi:hypothetical protein